MNKRFVQAIRWLSATYLLTGLVVCWQPVFGQRYLEEAIPYRNHAVIRTDDSFIEVNFTQKVYTGKASPKNTYYSYYQDSIYATQGGYHGHPLHGSYIERHANKGLKAMGRYTYGLRSGTWQHWDENGILRKVSHWKEGKETGKFRIYDETGELQQRGYLRSETESRLLQAWVWIKNIF